MSSRSFLLRCGAAVVLATTAACSLAVGFDGFAGPGGSTGDGGNGEGSLRGDGSRADNGPSGPGAVSDAGGSSSPPLDAADPNVAPVFVDGGSFCDAQDGATFCDDFDTADLNARWVREGVYARLTSYSAKSAPNDFLLDVPKTDTGGTFVSKITHTFDTPSTNLLVGFDFQPERTYLGSSFLILAALEYTKADAKYSLRLVYSNGNVRLEESNLVPPPNNKDRYHPFFAIPTGKWSRLKLDVVASGATPGALLSIDGVPVGAREALVPTPLMDPTPTMIVGAVFAGNPHTGWTLRYDNVTVTYR
jgi:hypothetical protein